MSELNNSEERFDLQNKSESSDDGNKTAVKYRKAPKSNFTKDLIDYVEIFAFALCSVILIFSFCFRLCTVKGPSMNNTLIDGENVIISDVFYTPKRGDIVVFHDTNTLNEPVVKRVIATGGEKVKITYSLDKMNVEITDVNGNTTVLTEEAILYSFNSLPFSYRNSEYTVPEGMIFVMGDNRCESMDSRNPAIGFVDERSVLGKVIFRLTPFSKIGAVK